MKQRYALVLLAALTACGGRPTQPMVNLRSNANETLTVALSAANVPLAIRALQSDPSVNSSFVGVQISPEIAPKQLSDVRDRAYVAALADARAKADALAGRLGLHGGVVRSVNEMARTGGPSYAGAHMAMAGMEAVSVSAPANGVVTLAVTYDFDGTPISVFGMQVGAPAEAAMADATGIDVSIQARGQSLSNAATRLRRVEAAVRTVAHRYGARDVDIVVRAAGVTSY